MTTIVIQNPNETPIKKTKTTVATNPKLVLIRQAVLSKVVDIFITGVIVYRLDNPVILVEDIARINAIGIVGMMIVIVTRIGILMIMKIPKGLMTVIRIEEIVDVQIDHHDILTDEIEAEIAEIADIEEDIEMNRIIEVEVIVKNLDRIEKQIHKIIRINEALGIEEEIIVKIVKIPDVKEHILHPPVQDVLDKNLDLNHQ